MKSFTKQTAMCVFWYSVTAKMNEFKSITLRQPKKMSQTEEKTKQNFYDLKK